MAGIDTPGLAHHLQTFVQLPVRSVVAMKYSDFHQRARKINIRTRVADISAASAGIRSAARHLPRAAVKQFLALAVLFGNDRSVLQFRRYLFSIGGQTRIAVS
jgi:hypothetical protein